MLVCLLEVIRKILRCVAVPKLHLSALATTMERWKSTWGLPGGERHVSIGNDSFPLEYTSTLHALCLDAWFLC